MARARSGDLISITLGPTVEAPSIARRIAADSAGSSLSNGDLDTFVLLVSELVANAVVHGDSWMHLSIDTTGSVARVEVTDGVAPSAGLGAGGPGDFGDRLLDCLASRWGVDARGKGKVVWFELKASG